MSVWVTPRTWTPGAVLAAADLDDEVRDKLTWLHSALMEITDGTISDTGIDTILAIQNAGTFFLGKQPGDSTSRIQIDNDGRIRWGDGGIGGTSATIYFDETKVIALEDTQFRIYRDDEENPGIGFRVTGDTSARLAIYAGWIEFKEIASLEDPGANQVRLFARDSGGKTQLAARFSDGSQVEVVIQP